MPRNTTGLLVGIFDLFHVGHLDLIRSAATRCDRLVVAVADDELVEMVAGRAPVVPGIERREIVAGVRDVSEVLALDELDVHALIGSAGGTLLSPAGEMDVVQAAVLERHPAQSLPAARVSASTILRSALSRTMQRSAVA